MFDCVNKVVPHRTQSEYYEDNKDTRAQYAKQYRAQNLEKVLERDLNYCQKTKDSIKIKRSKIFKCECGSDVLIRSKTRHESSTKHRKYIANPPINI